jgi:hypothetical protein
MCQTSPFREKGLFFCIPSWIIGSIVGLTGRVVISNGQLKLCVWARKQNVRMALAAEEDGKNALFAGERAFTLMLLKFG